MNAYPDPLLCVYCVERVGYLSFRKLTKFYSTFSNSATVDSERYFD